ncbi:oligopeptide transport system substrate-binding protein [Flavimobilis marinus]|uniref:Oligopeptide transport system substrate-binding protein n=2 Tax=Flavimobilis marinus TaxID=285351 RepID=A0A1I2DM65_9MICO|nr:oligopeptide transport system substrate-binding protein [Flavimobilis marinus]
MKNRRMAALAATILAGSLVLTACASESGEDPTTSGTGSSGPTTGIVTVNGNEPQNPLIPTMTNETGGGKIVDQLFAGLVRYDAEGAVHNEVAESIETEDNQTFTITLEDGWTFSDGTPVTAQSFVDAWNYGALLSNAQPNSYFFESIEGFSYDEDSELTGLEVVDESTFTVTLKQPESDFPLRLGYTAFSPLPASAFEDMKAFGENPVGNGPYMLDGEGAWVHNVEAKLVPNPEYKGDRVPQNGGVTVRFYDNEDAAYADLLSGALDIIDNIPASSFATFEQELGDRATNQPAAVIQVLTVPEYLPQFEGEAGNLRRQAISMAINREEITEAIFNGTRTPAKDFTSPTIDGWSDSIPGNEVLTYDAEKAKDLWAQAEAIEPWGDQTLTISSNADSDHQAWIDAVANSIRNVLGIEAEFEPYPQFSEFLDARDNEAITGVFRSGWQADYPALNNFLAPIYFTGAGSNDGGYSSEEFDSLVTQANGAESIEDANALLQQAQEVLFQDLPGIPLWYQNVTGGHADTVENVEFSWNSLPLLYQVTKSE